MLQPKKSRLVAVCIPLTRVEIPLKTDLHTRMVVGAHGYKDDAEATGGLQYKFK